MATSIYTIKKGDTLFNLAQQKLGDGHRWHEIKKSDGTTFTENEARHLWVGQKVYFPESGTQSTGTKSNRMVQEILAAHNRYRAEMGVPPLKWSNSLANNAQQWANRLAATGRFQHSGSGENLWWGTAGHFSFTDMVASWGNEKQYYLPGRKFPNVSRTGKWQDVGHYTQVIWRNTTKVGGGFAKGRGKDILVCHYAPAGNTIGQSPV